MFSLRDFVKKGFLDAIGKMADYQIVLNAAGWHEKGVLRGRFVGNQSGNGKLCSGGGNRK